MRLNPPLTILVLVGASLIALSVKREFDLSEQAQVRRDQCDVALTYLKELKTFRSKPFLLVEKPEEVFSTDQMKLAKAQPQRQQSEAEFVAELKKSKLPQLSPVKLCENVKNWATEMQARIVAETPTRNNSITPDWLITDEDGDYNWRIISISMPTISANGKYAQMNESQYFSPLAGGGSALKYKRLPDGTWEEVERMQVYVS